MIATDPLATTPRIVTITLLKSAKDSGGRSEVRIQLYGVPPMSNAIFTMSLEKKARKMNSTLRMVSFIGSSASKPATRPKFLNRFHTQLSSMSPIARATKTLYMVSAAGKYRRNESILQPSAPRTDVEIMSSRFIICSAIHSTILSKIPMRNHLISSKSSLRTGREAARILPDCFTEYMYRLQRRASHTP